MGLATDNPPFLLIPAKRMHIPHRESIYLLRHGKGGTVPYLYVEYNGYVCTRTYSSYLSHPLGILLPGVLEYPLRFSDLHRYL